MPSYPEPFSERISFSGSTSLELFSEEGLVLVEAELSSALVPDVSLFSVADSLEISVESRGFSVPVVTPVVHPVSIARQRIEDTILIFFIFNTSENKGFVTVLHFFYLIKDGFGKVLMTFLRQMKTIYVRRGHELASIQEFTAASFGNITVPLR